MAYYLDLYNGRPNQDGRSVLRAITGSATRTDITDDLATVQDKLLNPDTIVVSTGSLNQTNVNYVALFDAATAGTLRYTRRVGASQTIAKGNPVVFDPLALSFNAFSVETGFLLLANDADYLLLTTGADHKLVLANLGE